jgi:acyl-CoA thioesterase-2
LNAQRKDLREAETATAGGVLSQPRPIPMRPARTLDELLALEPLNHPDGSSFTGMPATDVSARTFGGHLLAQALMATARTVPRDWLPVSLHAIFLRPGDAGEPVCYQTGSPRDGRAYATRTVEATQESRLLAKVLAQWQFPEEWFDASDAGDALPELPPEQALPYASPGVLTRALDLRWVDTPTGRGLWFRPRGGLPEDPVFHTCVALYVSDLWLVDTLLRRFGERFDSPAVRASSLDHAAWFHRPPALDDWVYLGSTAPVAAGGRGLVQAQLRSAAGELLATFAQEASVRSRPPHGARKERRQQCDQPVTAQATSIPDASTSFESGAEP